MDYASLAIIGFLITAILVIFLFLYRQYINGIEMRRSYRNQEILNRAARRLRDQRFNMGGRIYNALKRAADENETGMIVVERWPENGGRYSVGVRFNETGVPSYLQAGFQVDISFTDEGGREISLLEGKYGPTRHYPASEEVVDKLLPALEAKTVCWGVDGEFPQSEAVICAA